MEHICLVGESDMSGFTPWWESHLPAYIIVWCLRGEAELTLEFRRHLFQQGMVTIIPPDMFPAFGGMTEDFKAFYCLMDRDFAEQAFYDLPKSFFEAIYAEPVLPVGESMTDWTQLLSAVYKDETNAFRQSIISSLLHAFALDYHDKWKKRYGDHTPKDERSPAETICMRFYNLIFDHFRDHRDTAFYADCLCITPCYLAMVMRQVCHETPKQAINRQVTLEMKYLLRNTAMTAEQIADHLHFPDTSYMCRFFRRQTGMSLSEYRKSGGD